MSQILLVRHGQASFGSANYDQLSELGMKQSIWLGEHLKSLGFEPSRIITGDLERHKQTAKGIFEGLDSSFDYEVDKGWNEFDFLKIGKAYLSESSDPVPDSNSAKDFFGILRKALLAWSANQITTPLPESWSAFETRVKQSLQDALSHPDISPVLVVSSGGAIAMALKHIMGFNNESMINMNLQSKNTGVSQCYFNKDKCYVSSFNGTAHLETKDRYKYITSA